MKVSTENPIQASATVYADAPAEAELNQPIKLISVTMTAPAKA